MDKQDFRGDLYRQYVSGFKALENPLDARSLESYLKWCRFRLGPLLAHIGRDGPVLEVGCGSGNLLLYLVTEGFTNVRGIDISPEQVQLAAERGLDVEVADVFDFLPRAPKVQLVLAIDFIEHFEKYEVLELLRLFYDVLEHDGWLIIQTPNGQGLFPHQVIHGDFTHLSTLSPASLRQALLHSGFSGIRFEETGPVPKDLVGVGRVFLWWVVKLAANLIRMIETGKTQRIWTENMICVARKRRQTHSRTESL
jgi:SAM-dependent methyltransferase